ncbi:MAG: ABC transporter permease [Planctomycetota bacterium]
MSLLAIAWKNLRQRSLASFLTGLSVALGVALMVGVWLTAKIVNDAFGARSTAYDLIVGPKGDPTQLVLSTVFHIGAPVENLPFLYYQELKEHPDVEEAVPVAFGDTTQEGGFPIVGTVSRYFKMGYGYQKPFKLRAGGHGLRDQFDAVVGSVVARENGWGVGSEFKLLHAGDDEHVHDEIFTVVGVLTPTGTPNDRIAFVSLNGFYAVAGHEKPLEESINQWRRFNGQDPLEGEALAAEVKRIDPHAGHDHGSHDGHDHGAHVTPDIQKEVTSILVRVASDGSGGGNVRVPLFATEINNGLGAQAVNPIRPILRIQKVFVGNLRNTLVVFSAVIVVVSGIGIFVSITNSMSERLREIAIMRALGARRGTVLSVIVAEAVVLCGLGGAAGLALGHGLLIVAAPLIRAKTDLLVDPYAFDPQELFLVPLLIGLAVVAALLPGLRAYRADVADSLG